MPIQTDTSILLRRRFDDFDELASAARHWDLDLMQIDRGRFRGEVVQAVSGGVLFSEARFGRTLVQQGAAPDGMRSFVVPAAPDVRFKWRGKDVGPNDLLAFPRSGELHAISNSEFHVFTISLPEDLLEEAARVAGASRLPAMLRRERVPCSSSVINPIRKRLRAVSDAARRDRLFSENLAVLGDLQLEILRLIVRAMVVTNGVSDAKPDKKRTEAAERAVAYISEFQDWPLSVGDLCRAVGLSERSLQYAFLEQFGVTPKSYLSAFRLNNARRELKRSKLGDAMICEIASRWGFWHMGQFAADYRRRFGELPSQTLASVNSVG